MPEAAYKKIIKARCAGEPDAESCYMEAPSPFVLVIFGSLGDLTSRKIVPALFSLYAKGLLPLEFHVLGTDRADATEIGFKDRMREAVELAGGFKKNEAAWWPGFSEHISYLRCDYADPASYRDMASKLNAVQQGAKAVNYNYVFYLAVPPAVFAPAIENLGASGLCSDRGDWFGRLVIEKPFGRDLGTAMRLDESLKKWFKERQIYRMDHYLAKENVQNILMFRFANSIFEPLWNRRHIDHVQITVSENIGVGHRAGYYESSGVLRDMFQNHMFQLLALTAMEPPSSFDAERVRDERMRVFLSMRPVDPTDNKYVVVGQYAAGTVGGHAVPAYKEEPGVDTRSGTPTYAAMRVFIDNRRWEGVPFYLRSGKRLKRSKAEISVHFKSSPYGVFHSQGGGANAEECREPNVLVLRVQPDEGIGLLFQTKKPGSRMCLSPVLMDFDYQSPMSLEAYERVLLDCMQGDQMLFVRNDAVMRIWEFLTPVIERVESAASPLAVEPYESGGQGPDGADGLIERDGRLWRPL